MSVTQIPITPPLAGAAGALPGDPTVKLAVGVASIVPGADTGQAAVLVLSPPLRTASPASIARRTTDAGLHARDATRREAVRSRLNDIAAAHFQDGAASPARAAAASIAQSAYLLRTLKP